MTVNSKRSILVVEDEDNLRTILSDILRNAGYEIKTASNGEEAITLLKKHQFDLTFLDIQMPQVNGIQVLKYIRQYSPATKAIMLTGYADLKHAMEAKEFGAMDFIGKPYKLEEIMSTVERALKS